MQTSNLTVKENLSLFRGVKISKIIATNNRTSRSSSEKVGVKYINHQQEVNYVK